MTQPTPEKILQTGLAFWPSKTLLSAIEMGVFTELARGAERFEALSGRLGLHPRSARDFLDTLVALGFLTRDVSIFVLMRSLPGRRRGDLAALGILFALYVLAPAIFKGVGLNSLLMLFFPQPTSPLWMSPALAWAEGIALASFALGRVALSRKPAIA